MRRRKAGTHFSGLTPDHAPAPVEQLLVNETAWKHTFKFGNEERPINHSFAFLRKHGRVGEILFRAFLSWSGGKRRATIFNCRNSLRTFVNYLGCLRAEGRTGTVPTGADLTAENLRGFASWVSRRQSLEAANGTWITARTLIREAAASFPAEVPSEAMRVPNTVGWSRKRAALEKRAQPYAEIELGKIAAAAEKECCAIMNRVQKEEFRVAPQRSEFLPFLVSFLCSTAANMQPLIELRRDCMSPALLGRKTIRFDKARAGKEPLYFYTAETADPCEPGNLVHFLLRWTENLLPKADKVGRQRVFLHMDGRKNGQVLPLFFKGQNTVKALRAFWKRHGIRPDISLRLIRETCAALDFIRSGGNIFRLKLLLGHRGIRTTIIYIQSRQAAGFMAKGIDKAQKVVVERLRSGPTVVILDVKTWAKANAENVEQAEHIIAGTFETPVGTCLDPYNSPQPGQAKGKLCTRAWACFSCQKCCILPRDLPKIMHRQRDIQRDKAVLSAAVWKAKYGEIDQALTSIIAAFPEEEQYSARQKLDAPTTVRTAQAYAITANKKLLSAV